MRRQWRKSIVLLFLLLACTCLINTLAQESFEENEGLDTAEQDSSNDHEQEHVQAIHEEEEDQEKEHQEAVIEPVDVEDVEEEASPSAPRSNTGPKAPYDNTGCKWDWKKMKCVPEEYCARKYQFLDATPGESCRLRNYKPTKHAFTKGIQMKPAVAVAGATALFAADIGVIAFTPAIKKAPLLFNILQGLALFVSGDTFFQVLEQGWNDVIGIDPFRSLRAGVIGALNNGLIHFSYYKWIDKHFPYHKFTVKRWGPRDGTLHRLIVAWAKYWIEWPTIGVYKIASSFALTALMTGNLKALPEKFSKRFMLTWLRSLQVWPIYDTILYAYVPTVHRPLFNTFMSIAWGGYLSHISQPEAKRPAEEDIPHADA